MEVYKPSANSQEIYKARYLDDDAPTIDALHRRVSGGKEEYFELMNKGLFLPNSPTLFNMGSKNGGTLSACFVFSIQDCLLGDWPLGGLDSPFRDSICGTTFKAMAVAKAGGGVGYYLGNIRQRNAPVNSTHRRACGPVTVLYWLNGINRLITQGGKRALAQMGVLNADHPDVREFIHCLSGDTLISTPSGKFKIKDLEGKKPLVYAIRDRKVFVQKAKKVWKTGVRKTIRVHLDRGGPIVCTPEHLIMLKNGKYKKAGNLVRGDRLMAFYRSPQRVGKSQRRYWMVGVTGSALTQKSYRLVMEYIEGRKLDPKEYVDHINNNPLDDSPKNLQILDPVKNAKKTKKYDGFTTKGWTPSAEQTAKRLRSRAGYRHSQETKTKMRIAHLNRSILSNHQVMRIEPWETIDVYDMEVPEFKNFVANDIVVHNCKDEKPHELSSFNISVSWRNKILEKVEHERFKDGTDHLVWDEETKLWWEQCTSAWTTGCPGMLFWDTINAANATPHLGDINATNPCGEVPNLTDEPCNLGSMALVRFFKKVGNKWVFMWNEYNSYLRIALRFMDDILDWNTFPHPDITKAAMATRKLGLGVMGYADALALLKIPYDSQDAVDWGKELAGFNKTITLAESIKLEITKGAYPAWEGGSDETKKKFPKCRNSTRTSIAPTGTINLLADASPSIEPHYALEWDRTTGEGIKLKEKIGVWGKLDGFIPKTANEIHHKWHIAHAAAWQAHTDLGVSKTINMPETATVQDVSEAYHLMWRSGCKGGTIYRDNCRPEQVLRKSSPESVYLNAKTDLTDDQLKEMVEKYHSKLDRYLTVNSVLAPTRKKMPRERQGSTIKFKIGSTEGYLTPNVYEDGTLGEIFIELNNDGSTLSGALKSFAKTFSLALQNNTSLEQLVELHKNSRFEPYGFTGDEEVPNCTSIIDYIVRKLEWKFLLKKESGKGINLPINHGDFVIGPNKSFAMSEASKEWIKLDNEFVDSVKPKLRSLTGQFCPDCGTELIREAGCMKCLKPGCGYSKC